MDAAVVHLIARGVGYLFLMGYAVGLITKILMPGRITHD